jgi:hypothetical protein
MRTDTPTLISAMRILAASVECDDGIANAAIAEAADRLEEMHAEKAAIVAELERQNEIMAQRADVSKTKLGQMFASGTASGLFVAIQVVQAGGALPLETNEEGK